MVLNFTANTYHWGCYGTSLEIYETLVDLGYYVSFVSIRTTQSLTPRPQQPGDFNDPAFAKTFCKANPSLYAALDEADVVVVNGEGSLHHLAPGPLNLLFLMHLAKSYLGKPVHLINHSFFPGGGTEPSNAADALYRMIAGTLDRVVPREPASSAVLARLGVKHTQGFDCLPRYLRRLGLERGRTTASVAISGGVNLSGAQAAQIAAAVGRITPDHRHLFISGAKAYPAREDALIYTQMRAVLPSLELRNAASLEEWATVIAEAECLVSARFHHTIAAAALGTPIVLCPSNTPKTTGLCTMLKLPPPCVAAADSELRPVVQESLEEALAGKSRTVTAQTQAEILGLAAHNFTGL